LGDSAPDQLSSSQIRDAAFHGIRWTAASRVLSETSTFAAMIVVARLVDPAAFGQVAVVSIVLVLATALFGDGLRVPLVQRASLDRAHVESAMVLALGVGVGLALVTAFVVPPVAAALYDQDTADLFRLAALAFLAAGVTAVAQALFLRRLAFREVAVVDTLTAVLTAAVSVGLAVAGLDATALLLGPIVAQFVAALVLVTIAPVPWPRWHRAEARELVRFGAPTTASGVVGMTSRNIDYAVLATRLDSASVGFYWRGYVLGVEYQRRISAILQQLALPLYARSESTDAMLVLRSHIVRIQTLVIGPLIGGLIVLAPIVVPLVLGSQWHDAVVPTQILAVVGLVSAIETGMGPLLIALGRPGALLRWNIGNLILLAVVVYIAGPHGVVAVCIAVTVLRLFRLGASLALLLRRVVGMPLLTLWNDVAPALTATAVLVAVGFGIAEGAEALELPDWTWGVTFAVLAPVIYLGVLRLAFPSSLVALRDIARRAFSRRGRHAATA
jgi:O-antigen/teichoic acid export membrane protein